MKPMENNGVIHNGHMKYLISWNAIYIWCVNFSTIHSWTRRELVFPISSLCLPTASVLELEFFFDPLNVVVAGFPWGSWNMPGIFMYVWDIAGNNFTHNFGFIPWFFFGVKPKSPHWKFETKPWIQRFACSRGKLCSHMRDYKCPLACRARDPNLIPGDSYSPVEPTVVCRGPPPPTVLSGSNELSEARWVGVPAPAFHLRPGGSWDPSNAPH